VPVDTLKGIVLTKLKGATGREVRMGAISMSVFPDIALKAADVKIGNPSWAGAGDMIDVRRLRLGIELIPLLHGQVHIQKLTLEEPVITLIKNGDQANWQLEKPASDGVVQESVRENAKTTPQAIDMAIPGHITIKGGRLTYKDSDSKAVQDISDITVDFKEATLSGSATINSQKTDITLTLSDPLGLAGGKTSDADMKLAFGHLMASYQGTVAFKDAKANITGTVTIPQIDAVSFSHASAAKTSPGGAPASAQSGHWSDAPINLAALASANADLSIKIGELILRKTTLRDIEVKVRLANAALAISTNEVAAYDGTLKLTLGLTSTGQANIAGIVSNVKAEPLLRDFADYDKLAGTLSGHITLATSGTSEHMMVSRLTGNGDFQMKDGVWKGKNILAMARNIGSAFGEQGSDSTPFSQCSGTFTVKDGVIANNDLQLNSPELHVNGQGTADLPGWHIQYLLSPKLVASGTGQKDASGITVPIRIEGSLDNPRYRPDLQAALKENFKNPQAVKDTVKNLKKTLLNNGGLGGLFR
jgi:AsmA protein